MAPLLTVLLVACGGGAGEGEPLRGSCRASAGTIAQCKDFQTIERAVIARQKESCEIGGTLRWVAQGCPRADRVGGCASIRSIALVGVYQQIDWTYTASGRGADDVRDWCMQLGETFLGPEGDFLPLPPELRGPRSCAEPGSKGNEKGVGKPCEGASQCEGQAAGMCVTLRPQRAGCSLACTRDDPAACGDRASCQCIDEAGTRCLCLPWGCF